MAEYEFEFLSGNPKKDSVIRIQDGKLAYKMTDGTYITYGSDLKPDRRFKIIKRKRLAKQISLGEIRK